VTGSARTRSRRDRRPDPAPPRVRVIGCGNTDAGDDAVGLLAIRALRRRLGRSTGVDIVEAPTGFQVLDVIGDARSIVVVDAVHRSGRRRPGTSVRVEVGPEGLPAELSGSLSTHGLGVTDAVGLGAVLGRLPRTVFLGIEVADVRPGTLLSPEVAYGLPALVDLIEAEVIRGSTDVTA
jgi:hydrogenase maturation protease